MATMHRPLDGSLICGDCRIQVKLTRNPWMVMSGAASEPIKVVRGPLSGVSGSGRVRTAAGDSLSASLRAVWAVGDGMDSQTV